MHGEAFHVRLPAGAGADVQDDRPRHVLLQLAVDLPHQLLALLEVGLRRLLVEQLLELLVAVVGVVALRPAGVVLVEASGPGRRPRCRSG